MTKFSQKFLESTYPEMQRKPRVMNINNEPVATRLMLDNIN